MIAILIKTYNREKTLFNTLESISKFCKNIEYKLYIFDDSNKISNEKIIYYDKLKCSNHFIYCTESKTSVTAARNFLVQNLEDEKYVLRIDDDFEFNKDTKLEVLISILDFDSRIGVISGIEKQIGTGKGVLNGEISPRQGFFKIEDEVLIKNNVPVKNWKFNKTNKNHRFSYCDFSRNFLMIRRSVFNDISWDESLPFHGEHEDFMLQIKQSPWKLAFSPDSMHFHREDLSIEERNKYKEEKMILNKKSDWAKYFYIKWKVKKRKNSYPLLYNLERKLKSIIGIH
ncbi:hypothetical protein MATR_17840 [Marivirga tractuosa]|uniref:Glycosyl transferase family 2 n=1 Tax=Marivirga tractuosa (strain ATCC 23168 / DSM 4126 / NBRC 15989 / NCIMB 1408 / VKM B-1430 / H-43) TaxID=643867 RepID=E4TQN0_MARTH|nr:glycosyltransferase family 2 protein [Marivirga tractuosa]ADR20591.1 glycosyl transferase family 2 [Marivirga tractuosa DSM 4126]BDD14959.1 hypothetical protein MATR_17840 [Marivirga tractuosa]